MKLKQVILIALNVVWQTTYAITLILAGVMIGLGFIFWLATKA